MKFFGGGGCRRTCKKSKPDKPQKAKKPRSAAKKVLITLLVMLCSVVAAGGIWVAFNVKPPSMSRPHTNNSTINDPENGDMPGVDLNMGDRISDFFTFVVCATDIDETRTDNIMVVAFDTKKHTVNVMNVPRDTMSNISKTGANRKINAAYGTSKGIEQTKKQVKQVMGFTPDKFIVVNFKGIAEIVDAIGGVDYDIPFPMMYSDPVQDLEINFPKAGKLHLNGDEVVDFLRWRKNSRGYTKYVPKEYENGDETRIQKQQEFLKYLAKEVLTLNNAVNAKKISDAVFGNVKTDITAGEMLWLAGQAFQVDTSAINMFTLPGYSASSTAGNSSELSFYFVNERQALKVVNEYFNPYDKKITSLDLVSGPTKGSGSKKNTSKNRDDEDEEEERKPSSNESGSKPSKPTRPAENTDSEKPSKGNESSGSNGSNNNAGGDTGNGNTGTEPKPDDTKAPEVPGGTEVPSNPGNNGNTSSETPNPSGNTSVDPEG